MSSVVICLQHSDSIFRKCFLELSLPGNPAFFESAVNDVNFVFPSLSNTAYQGIVDFFSLRSRSVISSVPGQRWSNLIQIRSLLQRSRVDSRNLDSNTHGPQYGPVSCSSTSFPSSAACFSAASSMAWALGVVGALFSAASRNCLLGQRMKATKNGIALCSGEA